MFQEPVNDLITNPATQGLNSINVGNNLNQTKAILFVFSHREIPDHYRRSMVYNFNPAFREAVQENIDRAVKTGMPSTSDTINRMMLDAPVARSAVLPNAVGDTLYMKPFSDRWTFLLIIDNDNSLTPTEFARIVPSRMIYSGWIVDEPVNPINFGQGYATNPQAILCTTHQMTLNVLGGAIGPAGMTPRHIDHMGDYEYIDGSLAQQMQVNTKQLYPLMPNTVASGMVETNGHTFELAQAPLVSHEGSIEIAPELNNPTQHLKRIVSGLTDSVLTLSSPANQASADIFYGRNTILDQFGNLAKYGANQVLNDLDPTKPFTIGMLEQKYGASLDLKVLLMPHDLQYQADSAQSPTRRNVFTSVITGSLPEMLSRYGLCEIGFRYNSFQPGMTFTSVNEYQPGIWNVQSIASLVPTSDEEQRIMFNMFKTDMETTIFPILKTNGGDFDLLVFCSLAGATLVDLNFLDEAKTSSGYIENNNLLGGLNTSQVGSLENLQHNAAQLYSVINDTSQRQSMSMGNLAPMGMDFSQSFM